MKRCRVDFYPIFKSLFLLIFFLVAILQLHTILFAPKVFASTIVCTDNGCCDQNQVFISCSWWTDDYLSELAVAYTTCSPRPNCDSNPDLIGANCHPSRNWVCGTCSDGRTMMCDDCFGEDCIGSSATPPPDTAPPPSTGCEGCGCGEGGNRTSCVPNPVCGENGRACCDPSCGGGSSGSSDNCMDVPRSQGPACCNLGCRGSDNCYMQESAGWWCDSAGWFCDGGGTPNNWSACVGRCGNGSQTNDCGTTRSCFADDGSLTNWSAWTTQCGYGTRTNACGTTESRCSECGPHWSACSATTFSRTGTYDCNLPITQACTATITGTFFDATEITSCAEMAVAPKIPRGRLFAGSTANQPPILYGSPLSNSSGAYTISNVRVPETYSLDTNMTGVDLALGKYLSTPRFACQASTVAFTGQGESATRDFGFWKVYDSWFQVIGGSIRAEGINTPAIQSHIPPTCTSASSCTPFLLRKNLAGTAESAGYAVTGHEGSSTGTIVTAYSGGDLSKLNEDNHQVTASSKRRQFKENYDYFINKIYSMGTSPQSDYSVEQREDLQKPSQSPINTGRQAYYANGSATIQTAWSVSNTESIVVFVHGSLTVKNTVTVAPGGFVAFIVSGDITIDPSVGTTDYASTTPQVEGLYIADGIFTVDSLASGTTKVHDKKFVGAGTFVGWNGVSLERDYQDTASPDLGIKNNTAPSEVFVARPDFQSAVPTKMLRPLYNWEEVAP